MNENAKVGGTVRDNAVEFGQRPSETIEQQQQPHAQPHSSRCGAEFPPPGIVFHPDDASNKVFMAMGKAFMSVVSGRSSFVLCVWTALE